MTDDVTLSPDSAPEMDTETEAVTETVTEAVTDTEVVEFPKGPPSRKPRLALMGEFSAGKSTLSNIMLGRHAIPTRVTATQLPPVWISLGDEPPYREDLDGNHHPVDPDRLEDVPVSETAFIRLFLEAEVLEVCDLIDTPGISDPNMPPEVWQRAADVADGVVWLTHATQAWRQSEAAVWTSMPEDLRPFSLLLLTRIDKITSERDRSRVKARVTKETAGLFRDVLPISLTEAAEADDDAEIWQSSGGQAMSDALLGLLSDIGDSLMEQGYASRQAMEPIFQADALPERAPLRVISVTEDPQPAGDAGETGAMPRRVVSTTAAPRPRPARPQR